MVEKIDSALFHYAGWLIRAAAFFGISRWQLIVGWIWVSGLATYTLFAVNPLILVILVAIITTVHTETRRDGEIQQAKRCYREDEVFASELPDNAVGRVLTVLGLIPFTLLLSGIETWMFLLCHLVYAATPLAIGIIMLVKVVLPHEYWYYFCLHQSPKDPVTLRKLVEQLMANIRKALTPTPQPQPVPVPISMSARTPIAVSGSAPLQ